LERQGLTCENGRSHRGKNLQELRASNVVTAESFDEYKNDSDECWEDDDDNNDNV
jgi:hypothetical protein